jgi:hypothetical protein
MRLFAIDPFDRKVTTFDLPPSAVELCEKNFGVRVLAKRVGIDPLDRRLHNCRRPYSE